MKRSAVAALLAALSAGPLLPAGAAEKGRLVPSITVVGSGKVTARPDMAELQMGVLAQSESAAKALKENSEAMDRLLKTLEARGIAKKDVQTSNFSVSPQYKQVLPRPGEAPQRPEIVGYQVSNQVRVKVRNLDALGQVLDEVVNQGANQVNGISFSVAEPEHLLDEARRKAMADARRKAELYATAGGVGLGQVLLVEEQTPQVPRPLMDGMARGMAAMGSVPVAVGEQDIGATITVTYAVAQPAPKGKGAGGK